jgi:hypothetical protein
MNKEGGSVECIAGPMFSGKTTELFRRVKRHAAAHERCIVLRYAGDTRYDDTHSLAPPPPPLCGGGGGDRGQRKVAVC